MPNTSSAKKALRQNHTRRLRNRPQRSALRTAVRKCRQAAESGDTAAAGEALRVSTKRLDQAAAKNLIHKNVAARTKSRLARFVKQQATAEQ